MHPFFALIMPKNIQKQHFQTVSDTKNGSY